jgi:hypothetical protein
VKSVLPHFCIEGVVERYETHSDVMRHVGADYRFLRPGNRPRVIDGITKSVGTKRTF